MSGYSSLASANDVVKTISVELIDPKCAALQDIPRRQVLQLASSWNQLSYQFNKTLVDTMNTLNASNAILDNLSSNVHKLNFSIKLLIVISSIEFTIVFFVTCGLLLVMFQCRGLQKLFRCFLRYFILPLFIFILLLNCIFTAIAFSVSSLGGDFCINSPDKNVLALVNLFKNQWGTNIVQLIRFYVSVSLNSYEYKK